MAKKQKLGFVKSTSKGPAALLLILGLVLILPGILFPAALGTVTLTGLAISVAGVIFIAAGIISIYLLGGARSR